MKTEIKCILIKAQDDVDETSPEYQRGVRDGELQTWASAPDMRNGLTYACGWIAGRFCKKPAPVQNTYH